MPTTTPPTDGSRRRAPRCRSTRRIPWCSAPTRSSASTAGRWPRRWVGCSSGWPSSPASSRRPRSTPRASCSRCSSDAATWPPTPATSASPTRHGATTRVYRRLLQAYLVEARAVLDVVDEVELDPKSRERARFAVSLFTEAAAPTNTLLGNPSALAKAVETRGRSLLTGVRHMAHDVRHNGGMPATVDTRPFTVGGNLAVTPGQVVHRSEVFELIQYAPAGTTTFARPLVAIPPQINKYYISDLAPGRSLIEHLVGAGVPYFAVSWRNPTAAQRDWNLDTYVAACKEAIEVACEITRQRRCQRGGHVRGRDHHGLPARPPRRDRRGAREQRDVPRRRARHRPGVTDRDARIEARRGGRPHPLAARRLPRRQGSGQGLRVAPPQRPGVELLGQQLPARPEPTRVRHPLLERRHHPPARGAARRLPGPGDLERARRGHPHGARHAGRSGQGRARRLRRGRLDRSHRALADRVPDHPAARRRVGVRAQLERPHPGHRQPAREPEVVLPHPRGRAAGDRRSMARRFRGARGDAGGSTGRHGSPPVPATDGRHRASSAAPPTRPSTPPRAATSTSHERRASSRSSASTGTSSGCPPGARAARSCSSWASAATSRCGTRSSAPSPAAGSRPSPTTRRAPATRRRGSSRNACTGWRAKPPTCSTRSAIPTPTCSASRSAVPWRRS